MAIIGLFLPTQCAEISRHSILQVILLTFLLLIGIKVREKSFGNSKGNHYYVFRVHVSATLTFSYALHKALFLA
jgi:hypothetical protein